MLQMRVAIATSPQALWQEDYLETDLKQLSPLGRVFLQRVPQHGLEGRALAVGAVAQEAEAGVQVLHTVLYRRAAQTPAPPCLHMSVFSPGLTSFRAV